MIIPAADLSEQISTAGMEASGTGNMKLALNGALTIGTLDGANIEIRDRVGEDNIFIFGLTADEVEERRRHGPGARETIDGLPVLQEVLDAIGLWRILAGRAATLPRAGGSADRPRLLPGDCGFRRVCRRVQQLVAERWRDRRAWWRASVLNTARMGWFSSDRAIREYAADIWNVVPRIT